MWNVPNSLTVFRIFLAPLLVVVLLTEFPDKEIWGLVIFLVAALTDALDGMIARRTNRITVTGAMLDPIADKLLMSAAFISLVGLDLAPAWMVTLIVGREFAVTGLRLIALERNVPISANVWGKAKTTTQIIAVSLLTRCAAASMSCLRSQWRRPRKIATRSSRWHGRVTPS